MEYGDGLIMTMQVISQCPRCSCCADAARIFLELLAKEKEELEPKPNTK